MPLKKIIWKDQLETLVFSSEAEAGKAAAIAGGRYIVKTIEEKGSCNIIFAAAVSQHEMLTELSENKSIDWSRVNAFHMDEYIGLHKDDPHTLACFFSKYPAICPGQFYFIDPEATDYAAECARYSRLLQEMPPDLVFCGVGDNGHLAFNEPHVADFNDPVLIKTVDIDLISRQQQVNAGNFPGVESVPALAYTLTVPALLAADYMICVAPTSYKAAAVERMLTGPIEEKCPASALRTHANAVMFVDSDSGASLL